MDQDKKFEMGCCRRLQMYFMDMFCCCKACRKGCCGKEAHRTKKELDNAKLYLDDEFNLAYMFRDFKHHLMS